MKILSFCRLLYRAPLAFFWTLFMHFFLVRLPQLFLPRKRMMWTISKWGKGLAWIMGVKIHKINERTGPMGDLIIANHMGFLDVPILLSCFPAVFIIKAEMRRVFFFGRALALQGHVFVDRADSKSRHQAGLELSRVLEKGERIIVFPEGRASPGAERRPFKVTPFAIAQRTSKRVEAVVIDYLPDRKMLEWDIKGAMFPQLVELFGRRRTDVCVEFFPAETVDDPESAASRYKEMIQARLEARDRQGAGEAVA